MINKFDKLLVKLVKKIKRGHNYQYVNEAGNITANLTNIQRIRRNLSE